MESDGSSFDRATAVELATAAAALPIGLVLAGAAVAGSDDPARALAVCAAVAVGVTLALQLGEALLAPPGRLRGVGSLPVPAARATALGALPGLLVVALVLALPFAVAWSVGGAPSATLAALPLGSGLDALVAAVLLHRWERRSGTVVLVDRSGSRPWTRRGVALAPRAVPARRASGAREPAAVRHA